MGGFMPDIKDKTVPFRQKGMWCRRRSGCGTSKSITLTNYYEIKSKRQMEAQLHTFLSSALDRGGWLVDLDVRVT